jgi:hypothetical protein
MQVADARDKDSVMAILEVFDTLTSGEKIAGGDRVVIQDQPTGRIA